MPPSHPEDEHSKSRQDDDEAEDEFDDRDEEEMDEDEDMEEEREVLPTHYRVEILERQYHSLETIFALAISALIILSLGVNWYFFKQTRLARGQVYQQKQYLGNVQKEFEKRSTLIRDFISNLENYAKTDPEFQRVLDKYRKDLGKYYKTRPGSGSNPDE